MMSKAPRSPSAPTPEFDLLTGDFRSHFLAPVEASWLVDNCAALVGICRQAAGVFERARADLFDWQRGIGQPVTADHIQGIAAGVARWQRNPRHAKLPRPLTPAPHWPWSPCLSAFFTFASPELKEGAARFDGAVLQDGTATASILAAFGQFLDACEDVKREEFEDAGPAAPPAPPAVFCAFAAMEYSRRAACVALEVAQVPSAVNQPAKLFAAIRWSAERVATARVALARAETERVRAAGNAVWNALSPQVIRRVAESLSNGDRMRDAVFAALKAYLAALPLKPRKSDAEEEIAAIASRALGRGADGGLDSRAVRRTLSESSTAWPGSRAVEWAELLERWHEAYPPQKKFKKARTD